MGLLKRGKSRDEEGYGRGEVKIHFNDDVLIGEADLVKALLAYVESPEYQPPTLPKVAMDLLRLSQQAEVDFKDVVSLLEQDSLIAGRVLKVVQSPVYAGAAKITSLSDALGRLGLNTLRDLVVSIAMNLKVYKCDDYAETMDLLQKHATATAHICKLVSRQSYVEEEYAFMTGLLHDVGIAGVLLALSDGKGKRKRAPDLVAIWPSVFRVHARAGEIMAKKWELPMDLQIPLGAHHQVMLEGRPHPVAATLCLADDIAHELGFGVVPQIVEDDGSEAAAARGASENALELDCLSSLTSIDRSGPATLKNAQAALDISDATLAQIRSQAEKLAEDLPG